MFTWTRGFGQLEENRKTQNKRGNRKNRKINQKDLSLFANYLLKNGVMILN